MYTPLQQTIKVPPSLPPSKPNLMPSALTILSVSTQNPISKVK